MSLFPDCFSRLGKFQCEPYHIQVDPIVPLKKTPYTPVSIYWQTATSRNVNCTPFQASGAYHTLNK